MICVKAGSLTYLKLASQSNLRSGSSPSPTIARGRILLPGQASLNSPHMAEKWEMRPTFGAAKRLIFAKGGWKPGTISPGSRGAAAKPGSPLLWLRSLPSLTRPPLMFDPGPQGFTSNLSPSGVNWSYYWLPFSQPFRTHFAQLFWNEIDETDTLTLCFSLGQWSLMFFLALKFNYFNPNKILSRIFIVDGNSETLMFLPTETDSRHEPGNELKLPVIQQRLLKIILFCVSFPHPVFTVSHQHFRKECLENAV